MSPLRLMRAIPAALVVLGSSGPAAQSRAGTVPPNPDDRTVTHVLNRLGFGPTPATIARLRAIGIAAYIDQQLHPERIADSGIETRVARLGTLDKTSRELADEYFLPAVLERRTRDRRAPGDADGAARSAADSPRPGRSAAMQLARTPLVELSQQKILRAAYSDRQLEEVLVDFWFNHFNVFPGKGQVRTYLIEYERDTIRPRVLGRFRDLLGATAKSPAMLFYLDNWQSTAAVDAPTSARRGNGRRLGATPRGVNENYARELLELHTLGVDGGYTQQDVQEVARAFTGWTIATPRLGGPFRFDPRLHDDGEKVVLGHRIGPGGGQKDGEDVLDLLARHPSTARHVATKLARRFVSDDPPAPLVARAAERFRQTDGDIREVLRTIVTSPEFFSAGVYRAKVKNPFEFVTSAVRAISLDLPDALPLVQAVRQLGMPLYGAQPPTGYADRADAWINAGALVNRMNVALALAGRSARNHERGAAPGAPVRATSVPHISRALLSSALANDVSEVTAATIARATTAQQAIALVLGSPEFQKK